MLWIPETLGKNGLVQRHEPLAVCFVMANMNWLTRNSQEFTELYPLLENFQVLANWFCC